MPRQDGWVRRHEPYNGEARQLDGVTVFASNDAGERRSFLRQSMSIRDGLREIIAELEALGEDWLIDCVSTPSSIYRDLNGRREQTQTTGGMFTEAGTGVSKTTWPEQTVLGQIGYAHMFRVPTRRVTAEPKTPRPTGASRDAIA